MPTSTSGPSEPSTPFIPGQYPSPPSSPTFASQRNLARSVYERRSEYLKNASIRIKIGNWNVAALPETEHDLAAWFVHKLKASESVDSQEAHGSTVPKHITTSDGHVGLYVLGLQEIIDISSPTEMLKPYADTAPAAKWRDAAQAALPDHKLVAEQQMSGLYLLVYASIPVTSVSTAAVGTGLMGYMGNKGAVATRIVIGGATRLTFICSHLAAGADRPSLERRNWDAGQVLSRAKFSFADDFDQREESIGDEDFAFWLGDLNYRLDGIPGDDVRRLLLRHTREAYGEAQLSLENINRELALPLDSVPEHESKLKSGLKAVASVVTGKEHDTLQMTLDSLLPHDQLHDQMRRSKAFHEGWQEGPITFLPTYKYDVGSVGMFDSSEKRRSPSWCDRVLYRTRRQYERAMERAKKTDRPSEEGKAAGTDAQTVLFDYDPDTDGAEDAKQEDEDDDTLKLEYYDSHQRVLSSDHKPITATFKLQYQAEDPDQKAKITAEVAKELDKAENEARPGITVDVEGNDSENLEFGDIRYGVAKSRTITIANTSQIRTTFGFAYSNGEPSHQWLSTITETKEASHTLDPGDTTQVRIVVHVAAISDVRRLNANLEQLEDVLVLRVHHGRDHFLPVHAKWIRTSFGLSLEALSDGSASSRSAPKQLFKVAEALEAQLERALAEWGMKGQDGKPPWSDSGWPFAQDSWTLKGETRNEARRMAREALDESTPFEYPDGLDAHQKVEVLAETMVRFVAAIEGGVIGQDLWTKLAEALESLQQDASVDEKRALVLETLSSAPASSVAFTYIVFTLARIVNEIAPPRSSSPPPTPKTADALLRRARGLSLSHDPVADKRKEVEKIYASIFARAIFHVASSSKPRDLKSEDQHRRDIVQVFLQNEDHG